MEALNIATNGFEVVAHIEHAADEYILHKPRKPPFQQPYFKSRCLWENKTAGYIVWIGLRNDLFMCHSNIADSPQAIGEAINEFKYDKAAYTRLKAQHRAGNSGAAVTTTTVTTTSREVVTKTITTKVEASSSSVPPKVETGSIATERVLPESELSKAAAVVTQFGCDITKEAVASETDSADAVGQTEDAAPPQDAAPAQDVTSAQDVAESSFSVSAKAAAKAAAEAALECDEVIEKDDTEVEEGKMDDDKSDVVAALQAQLDEQRKRADVAEEEVAHERKKHKQYIQTKAREKARTDRELQDMHKKLRDAPSKEEHEQLSQTLAIVSADEQAAAFKSHPKNCYLDLIQRCRSALDAAINSDPATAPSASATTTGTFEYMNNSNDWIAIVDATVNATLTKLMKDGGKVTYSFAGHTYEASRNNSADTSYDIAQTNVNPQFLTVRRIRDPARHTADAPSLSKAKAHEILFGCDTHIQFTPEIINSMLANYRFNLDQSYEMCLPLAELAEVFSSIGSGTKYTVPAGTTVSRKIKTKYFVSYSESGKEHNSELFVKPVALFQWLTLAKARGYRSARLIMHGGTKEAYEGIRNDAIGFDMRFAGAHGQYYGNGLYFGLSDHATKDYNAKSAYYPDGTCIIALLLTHEGIGWQHNQDNNQKKRSGSYTTISFSTPVEGMHNAIVVHETSLALPIGFVHAWDPKKGWVV